MRLQAVFTKALVMGSVAALSVPGIAFAATEDGPSKKEALLFGGLALVCIFIAGVLYKLFYSWFLDRNWEVSWAMGVAVFFLALSVFTVGLFAYLRLWPQPWHLIGWIADGVLWALLLILGLIGHFKYSA
ncbi:MAG: hypothetical protein K0R39_3276 [Symbiobacteriaceae bacterium]|nr:hypothetical protein [Symbiobacteriaceae bacterium]